MQTRLLMYKRLPNKDWSWHLVQSFLWYQAKYSSEISCNFSMGMARLKVPVPTIIPKQITSSGYMQYLLGDWVL